MAEVPNFKQYFRRTTRQEAVPFELYLDLALDGNPFYYKFADVGVTKDEMDNVWWPKVDARADELLSEIEEPTEADAASVYVQAYSEILTPLVFSLEILMNHYQSRIEALEAAASTDV